MHATVSFLSGRPGPLGACSPSQRTFLFQPDLLGSDRVRSPGAFSIDRRGRSVVHHSVSTLRAAIVCTRPENHVLVTREPRSDEELILRRSARLAAKSKHREPKPDAQARKILMKKLGIEVETQEPDKASFDEFQAAFTLSLPEQTRKAMETYYLGRGRFMADEPTMVLEQP